MSFYSDVAADALGALREFGMVTSLRRVTNGAYDETTATVAQTTATHSMTCVQFDFPLKQVDGTRIVQGDKQVLAAANVAAVPQIGDEILLDGVWWRVMNVAQLSPAGTVVIYDMQVRK